MSIPKDFIDSLRDKIDIVDFIGHHIHFKKKSGSNYFALCPFHQEKSGSFCVSQTKQCYHCFGCGAHGNAIDFIMNYEHLGFREAIESLAHLVGMAVPKPDSFNTKQNEQISSYYDLNQEIAKIYRSQLRASPRAIAYLKDRAISGEIAKKFGLGYAPNEWRFIMNALGNREMLPKKLYELGVIIKKDNQHYFDRFRDRIIFPIYDYRGRVIAFGGRIIDQGEPKYMNSPESLVFQKSKELYGLYQAIKSNHQLPRIVVVEGYMDVISLYQHDITYGVATLGTATTKEHLQKLRRYSNQIIFCFDGDEAGRTAATRALQILLPELDDLLQIRFLFLPEGEDPDSLVKKEKKLGFEKRIDEAISLSTFFFKHYANDCDMATIEGRAKFAASVLAAIKQIPAKMLSEMLLTELAKRVRLNVQELKSQLKLPRQGEDFSILETPINIKRPIKLALSLLIQYPQLANDIDGTLPLQKIHGLSLLKSLVAFITENQITTTSSLLEQYRGKNSSSVISSLAFFEHNIPEEGIKNEFIGTLAKIRLLAIDEEINVLLAKSANESLTEEEKKCLTDYIKQKKGLRLENTPK